MFNTLRLHTRHARKMSLCAQVNYGHMTEKWRLTDSVHPTSCVETRFLGCSTSSLDNQQSKCGAFNYLNA